MKKLLMLVLLIGVSISLFAGPFGLEMGWKLEDLEKNGIEYELYKQDYNISIYDVFPEREHPDFEEYVVKIDTEEGIFQISTLRKDISTSSYGTALKNKYETVRDQISRTYGEPKEIDFLIPDSIWNEPEYWMMALKSEERVLASFWQPNKDKGGIPLAPPVV